MKTLYAHIPFCEQKCFYCSFVVSVGQKHRIDQYLNCLEREAGQYDGMPAQSVYIGGGTPTLMDECQLERMLDIIETRFNVPGGAERTIESNPEGLGESKLGLLKRSGITRISLGVQSLNDKYLKILGRNHDSAAAVTAFDRIRNAGFKNVNVDLMFGFPGQTMRELREDVSAIVRLGSEHVSLYALTIEEPSRFFARHIQLADGSYQSKQYKEVCRVLHDSGFEQYEVSNFSRNGKISLHNLNYWQGGEYIGLGLGAHSYLNAKRFWNVSKLNDYIAKIENGIPAEEGCENLSVFEQMREAVLFGLRMNRGIDVEQLQQRFGCPLTDGQQKTVSDLIDGGFLIREGGSLKVSDKGRLVLDELCVRLF